MRVALVTWLVMDRSVNRARARRHLGVERMVNACEREFAAMVSSRAA